MKKFNVEYLSLTCLLAIEIKAKNRDEAEKIAFRSLMKYDRDSIDFTLVNEIDEIDNMIELETVVKQVDQYD